MMTAPQELLKEYVKSQHFTSTAEIMAAMKEMFRDVVQTAMEVELDEELGRERCQRAEASETAPNYRNGYSRKTVKTQLGEVEIKVPRDRNGSYEPKLIGKYSRNADGMEDKILALYACGMSQRDIAEQIKELYDVEISPELVTKITEKIMPEVTAWQNRPLDEAEENLLQFGEKWRKQYPSCVKSWEDNWEVLSTFYEYPPEIRKIIYTTNIIEGLNRQFRQITKNKPSFTSDDSLRRMLYLAAQRIVKHWHARCQNWDMVLSQLQLMFADRAAG